MSETYLNGNLTVSSLAVPTDEDIAKMGDLSQEEHEAMIAEALERAAKSGISDKTVDEIFEFAVKKARDQQSDKEHSLWPDAGSSTAA